MHGAISQDLCGIVPKRLSPAVHQTAQPARDPEQQHPGRERYDDQDHEEVRLSSEEVEHRTAFPGFQHPPPGSPPADWPRSSKPPPQRQTEQISVVEINPRQHRVPLTEHLIQCPRMHPRQIGIGIERCRLLLGLPQQCAGSARRTAVHRDRGSGADPQSDATHLVTPHPTPRPHVAIVLRPPRPYPIPSLQSAL
jgi:hypothetical protein